MQILIKLAMVLKDIEAGFELHLIPEPNLLGNAGEQFTTATTEGL